MNRITSSAGPFRNKGPVWVAVAVAVVGAACLWWLPSFLVQAQGRGNLNASEWATAISSARQFTLLVIGGALAIVGLTLSLYKHRRDGAAELRASDIDWTGRYSDAVKSLGDEKSVASQLGGVYALERLSQDSLRERVAILRVLSAFLRDKYPPVLATSSSTGAATSSSVVGQACIEIIGRISRVDDGATVLDLSEISVVNADLARSSLKGSDWTGSVLKSSKWVRALLNDCVFASAQLASSDFSGASLVRANMSGANLSNVSATGWNASQAQLNGCIANGAIFTYGDMRATDFSNAVMSGAQFVDSDLEKAIFKNAIVKMANFTDANLRDASFEGADISGANFERARGLTSEQVGVAAFWDSSTKLPVHVTLPSGPQTA